MKEENIGNGKLFTFFDWLWRLFVLNVLTLITSLGIITIFTSISACFKSIKDAKDEYTREVIKPYFRNFALLFKETIGFGILLVALIGISGYAYLWYDGVLGETSQDLYPGDSTWYTIAFICVFLMMGFAFVILMAGIQTIIVTVYFRATFMQKIRLSFFMAFKYIPSTLLEVVVIVAFLMLIIYLPLLPIWIFFGISVPLFLIYLISRRIYTYLQDNGFSSKDELDNKDEDVRENYEDDTKTNKGDKK